MAILLIKSSGITTPDGDVLNSAYCRIGVQLFDNETSITTSLKWWRDETAYITNKEEIRPIEVPFGMLSDSLNPTNYANVDMEQIHNVVASMLEIGDAHPKYPSGGQPFNGFGTGTTTVIMPS